MWHTIYADVQAYKMHAIFVYDHNNPICSLAASRISAIVVSAPPTDPIVCALCINADVTLLLVASA